MLGSRHAVMLADFTCDDGGRDAVVCGTAAGKPAAAAAAAAANWGKDIPSSVLSQ